jgi:hypothetical protein
MYQRRLKGGSPQRDNAKVNQLNDVNEYII